MQFALIIVIPTYSAVSRQHFQHLLAPVSVPPPTGYDYFEVKGLLIPICITFGHTVIDKMEFKHRNICRNLTTLTFLTDQQQEVTRINESLYAQPLKKSKTFSLFKPLQSMARPGAGRQQQKPSDTIK